MSEILGVLFAVFVGILFIPKFADYQTQSNENSRYAATAQQQKQVYTAATQYIKQNALAIQAITTATTPTVITVPMLKTAGLPAPFNAVNPYGQTWQVAVLQPTAGNLQAFVTSTGGTALTDKQGGKIMAIAGNAGGLIPNNDSGIYPGGAANAYGAFAGWGPVSTANYPGVSGGHPASLLTFNNGQIVSNYLYRNAIPGQPQLNQMNTAIDMQANNIDHAGQVTTGTLLVGSTAAIGTNATVGGNLGVGGTASAAKVVVPAGNNLQVGNSLLYGDSANTAIRQSGGLYVQHPDGSAADISQVGNVNATGNVTAAQVVLSQGNTANSLCGPNGAIGLEASNGNMLACKAGWWRRIGQLNISYFGIVTANGQTDLGWHSVCTLTGVTDANLGGVTQLNVGPFGTPSWPDGYWHWFLTNNSNGGQAFIICYQNT